MTKLLETAIATARRLSPEEQDEIARAMLALSGDMSLAVPLSAEERGAIERSKAAAADGAFATDEEVAAAWVKHSL